MIGAGAGLGQFHIQTGSSDHLRRRKMAFLFRALLFLGVFAGESNPIFDCKKKGDHHCSGRGQKLTE